MYIPEVFSLIEPVGFSAGCYLSARTLFLGPSPEHGRSGRGWKQDVAFERIMRRDDRGKWRSPMPEILNLRESEIVERCRRFEVERVKIIGLSCLVIPLHAGLQN
jgi:hypothetical protein